jgi:hypothetical protein
MTHRPLLFLDIDGVLCTWETIKVGRRLFEDGSFCSLDTTCIDRLNHITDATGTQIVISSSWRSDDDSLFGRLCRYLKHCGVKAEIVGRTPTILDADRGVEIQDWLEEHAPSVAVSLDFVILDDESDMSPLIDRLVQVKDGMNGGLQDHHAETAISLLSTP